MTAPRDTDILGPVPVCDQPEISRIALNEPALLSVFSKTRGPLTKRVQLDDSSNLTKDASHCALGCGTYRRVEVADLVVLDTLLSGLDVSEAVAFGVAAAKQAEVVARRDAPHHPGAITRTADVFQWPAGPAVFMLDYDPAPGAEPLTPDALHALVVQAMPELSGISMLWRPSASSCIYNTGTGAELVGIAGQRLYILVDRGDAIPRLGETLVKRLWLAGRGRIELSRAGALLERTLVDAMVWQPERLDFAAGALCVPPLERRSVPGRILPGRSPRLQAVVVPPLTDAERREHETMVAAVKRAAKPEQKAVQARYVEERAAEIGGDPVKARAIVHQALDGGVLGGEFPLHLDTGETVTVAEVLADKQRYHGSTLADPLEPEYGGGRGKAKLFLSGARPVVHSFAHGGRLFHLRVTTTGIEVAKGALHEVTERILKALAGEPDIFLGPGGLVLVDSTAEGTARQTPLNLETLTARVVAICSFHLPATDRNPPQPIDPPSRPLAIIAKRRDRCGIRELDGVVTAPTLRPDGSVLDHPGYDSATRLLLLVDEEPPDIPGVPTRPQAEAALEYLIEPFRGFSFANELDWSVFLSALLTAVVRRTLPTAPGFVVSATTAGTGKTKLGQCVDILAGGTGETRALPGDSEEMRKALTAALMEGRPSIIFDNVSGHLRGDVLCAVLTSPVHTDRILGVSQSAQLSTRTMLLFTGNNLEAAGDLSRRVLRVELDPGCAEPWRRRFEFEPVARVRERRQALVAAALTVLRGYIAAGHPEVVRTHTGSFEGWSRLVRSTVVWLGWTDPEQSLLLNLETDPETQALRDVARAWLGRFGADRFVLNSELATLSQGVTGASCALADAFHEALPRDVTPRAMGKWLAYRKGRIVDGHRFVASRTGNDRGWMLQRVDGSGRAAA
jgi:hypothetical protein